MTQTPTYTTEFFLECYEVVLDQPGVSLHEYLRDVYNLTGRALRADKNAYRAYKQAISVIESQSYGREVFA